MRTMPRAAKSAADGVTVTMRWPAMSERRMIVEPVVIDGGTKIVRGIEEGERLLFVDAVVAVEIPQLDEDHRDQTPVDRRRDLDRSLQGVRISNDQPLLIGRPPVVHDVLVIDREKRDAHVVAVERRIETEPLPG